jgi:hypothetical protein
MLHAVCVYSAPDQGGRFFSKHKYPGMLNIGDFLGKFSSCIGFIWNFPPLNLTKPFFLEGQTKSICVCAMLFILQGCGTLAVF